MHHHRHRRTRGRGSYLLSKGQVRSRVLHLPSPPVTASLRTRPRPHGINHRRHRCTGGGGGRVLAAIKGPTPAVIAGATEKGRTPAQGGEGRRVAFRRESVRSRGKINPPPIWWVPWLSKETDSCLWIASKDSRLTSVGERTRFGGSLAHLPLRYEMSRPNSLRTLRSTWYRLHINLGILGGGGVSVVQDIRVKGHVRRRVVVSDPAVHPPI